MGALGLLKGLGPWNHKRMNVAEPSWLTGPRTAHPQRRPRCPQALEFKCTSLVARRDWLRKRAVFRAWRGAAVETRVHAHRLASFVNARAHAVQSRAFGAWKALTARFAAARAALAVSVRAAAGAVSQASLLRASLVGWAEVANEGAQVAETTALRASRVLQNRRERRAFVAWRAEAVAAAQRRAAADEVRGGAAMRNAQMT